MRREAWLKSNINRLALTFKRPVIGVHNQTSGIIFDVIECLVQRNFGLATRDVREAYKIVKEKLYNPGYTKVVFLLHSQGGIEGGLVLDWLLQELPQDLLSKLEVYTFGNAANHFNNPHRHVGSQAAQEEHGPVTLEIPQTVDEAPAITDSPVEMMMRPKTEVDGGLANGDGDGDERPLTAPDTPAPSARENGPGRPGEPLRAGPRRTVVPAADRAIAHVEHYAHTTDFVALWGVLRSVTGEAGAGASASASASAPPPPPRFIGRVFSRASARGGHQLSLHYLNGMFPLARDAETGRVLGCADRNDFMDSLVEAAGEAAAGSGGGGDQPGRQQQQPCGLREGLENSWAKLRRGDDTDTDTDTDDGDGDGDGDCGGGGMDGDNPVAVVRGSFCDDRRHRQRIRDGKVRVKDLSRLWLYRNGRSPPDMPRGLERRSDAAVP